MELLHALRQRKSIRGYRPDPVPKHILEQILEAACRAPSAMNTQPWEFYVVAGGVLDEIRRRNIECLRHGTRLGPEHIVVGWPKDSVYRRRQVELAKQLFGLMGIKREDTAQRAAWMERGFRYFDAPAAIIVVVDTCLTEKGPLLDIGAVVQNICLAALEFGLGTCIEDQGVMFPEVLREVARIPTSKRIVIAIAIGYPDPHFPANAVRSEREPVASLTTWLGFE